MCGLKTSFGFYPPSCAQLLQLSLAAGRGQASFLRHPQGGEETVLAFGVPFNAMVPRSGPYLGSLGQAELLGGSQLDVVCGPGFGERGRGRGRGPGSQRGCAPPALHEAQQLPRSSLTLSVSGLVAWQALSRQLPIPRMELWDTVAGELHTI